MSRPTPEPRQSHPRLHTSAYVALVAVLALVAGAACERTTAPEALDDGPGRASTAVGPARELPQIVCLGDSLTAGLGLDAEQAYPALLEQRLRDAGYRYQIVNAGVSGDTSAGGLRRLNWSLGENVRVLVLALGANDGLRGLSVASLRNNLSAIVEQARSRDIAVLLVGMEAPPNFGPAYTREFREVYAGLAAEYDIAFVPFLLEGVAGVRHLNQTDGIHPTAEGQRAMANLLWPELERVVKALETR